MGRPKISKEEIIRIVEEKGLHFVKFINYCGAKSTLEIICENNHDPYIVNFATITKKDRKALGCPKCKSKNKSITNINRVDFKYIKEYIESFGYTLLTDSKDYHGLSVPITVKCPNNHIFDINFSVFKKRETNNKYFLNKCEFCFKEKQIDKAKKRCEELEYTLLTTKYTDRNMKLDIICDKEHEWHPTYENFMRNNAKCLTCNNILLGINQRLSIEKVKSIVEEYDYKLISDYKNNQELITLLCPNNHIYKTSLSNFIAGKRCSTCSMSSGEQEIYRVLKKYNINLLAQYTFKDCKDINPLPFDFYLPDHNSCIEFDGRQHYTNINFFYKTNENFQDRVKKDNIKTQYCKDNNIKLIRIPYWDFDNIENILCKELNLIRINFND